MTKWDPDWVVSPGEILREWMEENGISARLMAVASGGRTDPALMTRHVATINHVLKKRPMTRAAAGIIARGTQIPVEFWQALEHNYRYGLARGKKETA